MARVELLVPHILKWEGGFSDDPDDAGGATFKGVTLETFRHVYGQGKTVQDLKAMTTKEWTFILKKTYWDNWKADSIDNQSIANFLVDWHWGSGSYGITIPQYVLGVTVDGQVGPKTIHAVNSAHQEELFNKLVFERKAFVSRIVKKKPKQIKFLGGWLNRINDLKFEP